MGVIPQQPNEETFLRRPRHPLPKRIANKPLQDPAEIAATNQWGDLDAELQATVVPGSTSQVAVLNRELKALEVRYFRTRLQLEKITEKNDQLRQEMSKCKSQSVKTERDNAKLRHLIDRIQGEKKNLEQQAISNRDYAKKIEQRFFMGTKGQSLVQCNLELSARIKSLEQSLAERESILSSQSAELREAQDKSAILRRALETRFDELQLNGSLHNGILFELTRLQDQNASMALQLGEERKMSKTLEIKLEHARGRHTELEEALVVRETWFASLEKERAVLAEQVAACHNDKQTFAFEKATLLKFIQEQAEAKLQLEAQLKQVRDAKLADIDAFHAKLQLVLDEKQAVQETLNTSHLECEKSRMESLALSKSLKAEQERTDELRNRQHELLLEIQRQQDELKQKEDDFAAAKEVCREVQAMIDAKEAEERNLRDKVTQLETTIHDQHQEINRREQEELALRAAMENALRDLETLSKQRNEATRAMNEAVTISASSLEEQQTLENKVQTQQKQLEQLKHSKNLLQNAMLEQLSALRKQLQTERMQRIEAEAKLKQLGNISVSSGSSPLPSVSPMFQSPGSTGLTQELSMNDEMQPLPPPEISLPSPLPPELSLFQSNRSSASYSLPSAVSSRIEIESPPAHGTYSQDIHSTPERTTTRLSSPCENISLLELAEDMYEANTLK
ncbi:hypothetical protein Poli38472_000092 [Pythium oligandrum]|uniref:Uncharacterized protein n=1 Tax=Pythium oligandrum TaxID=41045 RepID=A0A8K1CC20_PYTOL|nr:hypothetical protein Poli38472_000092 [Pythium oligandrum]|eukprot:TMW60050.1 hypothetical protein Poli38472_000092 [Pythium oligandrum]